MLGHGYKHVTLGQNIVLGYLAGEILLLLASGAVAALFVKVSGSQKNIVTLITEVCALECVPMLNMTKVRQKTRFPLPSVLELRETEPGLGFAFAGEKLLHQPFFVGLERDHLPRLRGDQLVQRTQAVGDLLLLRKRRKRKTDTSDVFVVDTDAYTSIPTLCYKLFPSLGFPKLVEIARITTGLAVCDALKDNIVRTDQDFPLTLPASN